MNPVGNPLANSSQRADARGDRRPQVRRGQDQGHGRLRALPRRVHRGQDAQGRPRRRRLGRPDARGRPVAAATTSVARQARPDRGLRPRRVHDDGARHRGHDPKDDRNFRSHLGLLVTRRVNKLVLLPGAQGPRLGGRHRGPQEHEPRAGQQRRPGRTARPRRNVCNQFIPQVVSHPILRRKCVLQIMDGIKGVFQGGPFGRQPGIRPGRTTPCSSRPTRWRWTTSTGGSSTPSARRRGCRRSARPASSALDPLGTEGFDIRQPQHIALAANLGLGRFDRDRSSHHQCLGRLPREQPVRRSGGS